MANLEQLVEDLSTLTVMEAAELAEKLEEKWGVSAAAAAPVMVAGAAGGEAAAAEEKTDFDIMLNSAGSAKLAVVKEVKNLLGVGLKDAKGLVDGAPAVIKEGVPKAEAESIKAALEAAGADVELK